MPTEQASKPTVRAVVAYAEQLREEAVRRAAKDPWTEPYRPTEAAARKLTQRLTNQRIADLARRFDAGEFTTPTGDLDHDTYNELVDDAPHHGAAAAIAELTRRAAEQLGAERAARERSERAALRLRKHHDQDARDQAARRKGMSPGQRIDIALANLHCVTDVSASRLDGDRVSGSTEQPLPVDSDGYAHLEDAFTIARRKVLALADELEQLLDGERRRNVRTAA